MRLKTWASLSFFILLSIVITWPLIFNFSSLTSAGKEEFLISFLTNWNAHALLNFPTKIFQAPFFYPVKNALAFSDPLITNALIALPLIKLFNNPFLSFNLNLFLSFVLSGFFTFLLVNKITKKFWPSITAGILFSFSIGRLDSLEHLQVLSSYWIPLGLYFFLSKKPLLTSICFLLQSLNTIFLGYVFGFALSIFSIVYYLKKKISKKYFISLIKYLGLSLVVLFYLFKPYWQISKEYQYTRSLNDIKAGSAYFLEYLYPTSHSQLQPIAFKLLPKNPWPAYLGFPVSIFGLISLIYLTRRKKSSFELSSIIVFFTGLILSLGPYLHLTKNSQFLSIPLPYWFLYYFVPGFKSMRVPQRWSHLALFSLSLLVGLFLTKLKTKKQIFLSILIIFLVFLEPKISLFQKPVKTKSQVPAVYHWLSIQPSSVVLELPAQTWVMPMADLEIQRLHYHSFFLDTNHQFINGFSGFEPPIWTKNISLLRTSSPAKAINIIKELDAKFIIAHHHELELLYQKDKEALPLKATLETIESNYPSVYEDKNTSVYKI